MPKVISLVSKSTRLVISLQNEDCEFSMEEGNTAALLFDTGVNGPVSSVSLVLITKGKMIHSYNVPCHPNGRVDSVRIDAIYPTVFGDEKIDSVTTMCSDHTTKDSRPVHYLLVKLIFDGQLSPPVPVKINSVDLTLDSATVLAEVVTVPVSKEVLGASSDFFTNLLYGNFAEKNSGSYCVKEVDGKTLAWLINSLIERNWKFTSVEQALDVLSIADRFCMMTVHKHILQYLNTARLGPEPAIDLKRYIDIAARCPDNGEFVRWIFDKCKNTDQLIEVAQSCGSSLSPHLDVYFQFLTVHRMREKNNGYTVFIRERFSDLSKLQDCKDVSSLPTNFYEIDWCITLSKWGKNLRAYLEGKKPNADNWSCAVSYEIQLISQKNKNIVHSMGKKAFTFSKYYYRQGENLISFKDLFDKDKGFVKDKSIVIAVSINLPYQ